MPSYTINQFRTNLDYVEADPNLDFDQQPDAIDQAENFKNPTLYSNINLEERFSPLLRLEFEMKKVAVIGSGISGEKK